MSKQEYFDPISKIPDYDTIPLFKFDPNKTTKDEWLSLGLNEKQISTIQNYISKGGKFYQREDLKKIYGLSTEQFEILQAYIQISAETKIEDTDNTDSTTFKEEKYIIIDINSADQLSLKTIKGIGTVFSDRIIKYRNLLGGFVNKDQLLEIYGLTDETFQEIKPFISIDTLNVRKLNINTADFNEFNRHPYLSEYQSRAILSYRKFVTRFVKIEEIQENNLLNEVD